MYARSRRTIGNHYTSLEKEGERVHAPVGDVALSWFEQNFRDLVMMARGDNVLPVLITQATLAQPINLKNPSIRDTLYS